MDPSCERKNKIGSQKQPDQDIWTCICSDGKIEISLRQFKRHSEYFVALIRSDLDELSKRKVNLELISADTISCIKRFLDILDSKQFELVVDLQIFNELSLLTNESNQPKIEVLLTAIDYLDIHSLHRLCDKYLSSLYEISTDSITYLIQLYIRFSFKLLGKKIRHYLLLNAGNMMTSEIIEILPFSLLKCLVESKKCNVSMEWDLVKILDKWCSKHCRTDTDHQNISELANCIKIPKLAERNDYGDHLEQIQCLPLGHLLKAAVCEYEGDPGKYTKHHPSSCQSRRGRRLLLAMRVPFGRSLERACSFSEDFNTRNNQGLVLHESPQLSTSIPCESVREFCVCTLRNHVYVGGGQRRYSLSGLFAIPHLYRLDLDTLEWTVAQPMTTSRCMFHMDVVGDSMYSVGGINADGELETMERYDALANLWTGAAALDYKITEHAGCVHKNKLYISGGHDGCSHVNTVSRYDAETDTWSRCAALLLSRSCHSMECLGDRLYVIGGRRIRKNHVAIIQTMECYSTVADQWIEVQARLPSVFTACLSVYTRPLTSQLLVLGGYSYKQRRSAVEMHSFSESTCAWNKVPLSFDSTRKKQPDVAILEVRVNKEVAEQLVKNRRTCTLKQ